MTAEPFRREGRWEIFPRTSRRTYRARLEKARSIAVRLEQEIADVRRALVAVHEPKAVGGGSDPEEPTIICRTCSTDFPCETRSFLDALDPVNGLDEFAGQPDPF